MPTLDATAQSGQATAAQTAFSFNHVLGGGANRAVFVGVAGRQGGSGSAIPTPTYNGVSMTLVQGQWVQGGANHGSGLWVMKESALPAAGTYAVACTFGDADTNSYGLVAASYTVVDGTTPTSNPTGGNAVDGTPTITIASAIGNLVLSVHLIGGDPASSTLVADGTEIIRNVVANGQQFNRCVMQTKAGAASVTMAPTQVGTSTWYASGASVNAPVLGAVAPTWKRFWKRTSP
jgi:hypothetical protein